MSYVDAAATVSQLQSIGSTFTSLGQELDQGASVANFQDVLVQMRTALASLGGTVPAAPSSAPSDAQDSLMSTSSLMGTGSGLATTPFPSTAIDPAGTAASGLAATAVPGSAGTASGAAVVADASQFLGVPYQWGGTSPAGFDCSGLVQYVYREAGIALPRTSEQQSQVGVPVASLADAQPGDLVFFPGSDGTAASPGHVGIYIGNDQMIVAPHTGTVVQIQSVGDPTAIRRILPSTTTLADTEAAGGALLSDDVAPSGLAATTGWPGSSLLPNIGVPSDLAALFEQAGQAEGVSPALLAAVAKQESGFQTGAVSSAGAEGLMQLMPATAAGLGIDPLDPAQAVDGAATMLHSYLDRFGGSVPLALAAYNAGPGAVESYGGVPPYAQTQSYVASIMAMLGGAPA